MPMSIEDYEKIAGGDATITNIKQANRLIAHIAALGDDALAALQTGHNDVAQERLQMLLDCIEAANPSLMPTHRQSRQ